MSHLADGQFKMFSTDGSFENFLALNLFWIHLTFDTVSNLKHFMAKMLCGTLLITLVGNSILVSPIESVLVWVIMITPIYLGNESVTIEVIIVLNIHGKSLGTPIAYRMSSLNTSLIFCSWRFLNTHLQKIENNIKYGERESSHLLKLLWILPPFEWIFYFLSSCYISDIQNKCTVKQLILHINWYCVYKCNEEGLILTEIPPQKVLAGAKFQASGPDLLQLAAVPTSRKFSWLFVVRPIDTKVLLGFQAESPFQDLRWLNELTEKTVLIWRFQMWVG